MRLKPENTCRANSLKVTLKIIDGFLQVHGCRERVSGGPLSSNRFADVLSNVNDWFHIRLKFACSELRAKQL